MTALRTESKKMSISKKYNLLNLPDVIQFGDGHQNYYTYSASGQKLNLTNYTLNSIVNVPQGTVNPVPSPSDAAYKKTVTDYVGNVIYGNGLSLQKILTPEGYIQDWVYCYYLKDHLENNRIVIDASGNIREKSHYYPSGMRFYPESTSGQGVAPLRLTGKEYEAMNGLNQYDFGARRRFTWGNITTTMDLMCEKFYGWSTYSLYLDNPVRWIDKDGKVPGEPEAGGTPSHMTSTGWTSAQSSTYMPAPVVTKTIPAPLFVPSSLPPDKLTTPQQEQETFDFFNDPLYMTVRDPVTQVAAVAVAGIAAAPVIIDAAASAAPVVTNVALKGAQIVASNPVAAETVAGTATGVAVSLVVPTQTPNTPQPDVTPAFNTSYQVEQTMWTLGEWIKDFVIPPPPPPPNQKPDEKK